MFNQKKGILNANPTSKLRPKIGFSKLREAQSTRKVSLWTILIQIRIRVRFWKEKTNMNKSSYEI